MITLSKEEMIQKYATNEMEETYIDNLSNEVYEEVSEVIESMEDWNNEQTTFYNILEQAMVTAVHRYDFKTLSMIEKRFPNIRYTLLHYKASGSEYDIKMDETGFVTFEINMTPEQHMIMSLLGTLEDMEEFMLDHGIADNVIINNTIEL